MKIQPRRRARQLHTLRYSAASRCAPRSTPALHHFKTARTRTLSVTPSRSAQCDHGHVTCDKCFERYASECASRLETTNLLASEAEKAEGARDDVRMQQLAGQLHCPSCKSGPFTDRQVALHTSDEGFAKYCGARALLPAARKVKKALEKGAELKALFPHARQCGSCGFGPVEHMACGDLAAHHGELRAGDVRIDNACPACGWFAESIEQWPQWDGLTQVANGNEDPLERTAVAPAVDNEATAREARRRRGEELERWREERQRDAFGGGRTFDTVHGYIEAMLMRNDEFLGNLNVQRRLMEIRPARIWRFGEREEEERRMHLPVTSIPTGRQHEVEEERREEEESRPMYRSLQSSVRPAAERERRNAPRLNAQQAALSEAMFGTVPDEQPGRRQRRRERQQRG